jgi:ferritin
MMTLRVLVVASLVGCGWALTATAVSFPRQTFTTTAIASPRHAPLVQMGLRRFAAWHPDCETALNKQIAVETAASFQYLAMYAFFDRPNVALKQAASFFEKAQGEEIGHAKAFIKYQNTRGGKVQLQQIQVPEQDFTGDASQSDLCKAMAKALELEIFVYDELLTLHKVSHRFVGKPCAHACPDQAAVTHSHNCGVSGVHRLLTAVEILHLRITSNSTSVISSTPSGTWANVSLNSSVSHQAGGMPFGTGTRQGTKWAILERSSSAGERTSAHCHETHSSKSRGLPRSAYERTGGVWDLVSCQGARISALARLTDRRAERTSTFPCTHTPDVTFSLRGVRLPKGAAYNVVNKDCGHP